MHAQRTDHTRIHFTGLTKAQARVVIGNVQSHVSQEHGHTVAAHLVDEDTQYIDTHRGTRVRFPTATSADIAWDGLVEMSEPRDRLQDRR